MDRGQHSVTGSAWVFPVFTLVASTFSAAVRLAMGTEAPEARRTLVPGAKLRPPQLAAASARSSAYSSPGPAAHTRTDRWTAVVVDEDSGDGGVDVEVVVFVAGDGEVPHPPVVILGRGSSVGDGEGPW